MWLDGYDDIFSDFDPRPYEERAISDDFLNEAVKMFRENPKGNFELRLLIPNNLLTKKENEVVAKRLKHYFKSVKESENLKIKQLMKNGFLFTLTGFLFLFAAVFVSRINKDSLLTESMLVVLEPAGWFSFWTGLDKLFFDVPRKRESLNFYVKMAEGDIKFEAYTED